MNLPIILHHNVTPATMEVIQFVFGSVYSLVQIDVLGEDLKMEERKARIAMTIIGVDNEAIELPKNLLAPTILISRQASVHQELKAFEAGAVDYLSDVSRMPVLIAR